MCVEKAGQAERMLAEKAETAYSYGVRVGVAVRLTGSSTGGRAELRRAATWALGILGLFGVACSGNAAPYASDAESGTTHALISIERRDVLGTAEPAQNRAFATFLRAPPDADPALVMRVAALGAELPEVGECASGSAPRESAGTAASLRRVELLDAGDVALETADGRVELAPRPFPAVTSLFSGVVYTTRERVAALPAAEVYAINASGGALGAPLGVSAEAPPILAQVALDGTPLQEGAVLGRTGGELTWARGAARDVVYVTVTSADGAHRVTCSYRDEAGRGVLPAGSVPEGTPAALSLHRLRVIPVAGGQNGVNAGELRFDFELSATVAVRAR
jgi:hypothetical protein